MRYILIIAVSLFSFFLAFELTSLNTHAQDKKDTSKTLVTEDEVQVELEVVEIEEIEANPQRAYCANLWTRMYERQKTEIRVSTRGKYDEIAVFDCPDCSLKEHFVKPYLESEYRGMNGLRRLHECGFKQAVFEGTRGIQEIVVDVPSVFPDPNRMICVTEWNDQYQRDNANMMVSSRGELDESVVFTCPACTSERRFIKPFLRNVYAGASTTDRLKECGFVEVVFTDPNGRNEVVKKVR